MTETEQTEQKAIELLSTLSPISRGRVLDAVQSSMPTAFDPSSDPEVARRIDGIDSGRVECIPHQQVMAEVDAMLDDNA